MDVLFEALFELISEVLSGICEGILKDRNRPRFARIAAFAVMAVLYLGLCAVLAVPGILLLPEHPVAGWILVGVALVFGFFALRTLIRMTR